MRATFAKPVATGLLALLLPGLIPQAAAEEPATAFLIGRLWPGNGEPIRDAVLLVRDGVIAEVGPRSAVSVPDFAEVHDLSSSVVIPGLVIAETTIGVADDDERTVTPEVRAIDGFDLFEDYSEYLAAGITTVQISPGRQRLMPGQGAVVRLAGSDPSGRTMSVSESLRIVLGDESADAPRIYEPPVGAVSVDNPLEPTRPQISESLAVRVAGLRAVFLAAQAGASAEGAALNLAAIRECLERGRLRITARDAAEVRAALELNRDLRAAVGHPLSLILSQPRVVAPLLSLPEELRPAGVILQAGVSPGRIADPDVPDADAAPLPDPWELAATLATAELADRVAISAPDDDLSDILFLAGLFTRGGNSPQSVLAMVTANPAAMLGVADRVGTLEPGKDADFVVLTDDPFAAGAAVRQTWIQGRREYTRPDSDTSPGTMILRAAAIHNNDGVVQDGAVVVSDGRIRSVGTSVSAPESATVSSYPEGVIVPGFIDLASGLGFGGSLSGINLSTTLGDCLASDDPQIAFARETGVTTAVFSTSGSPSPLLAFKLSDTPRLLREPVAIRFNLSENLTVGVPAMRRTLQTGKAYADSWTKYEQDLAEYQKQLKEYEAALAKYEAERKAAAEKKAASEDVDAKDSDASEESGDDPKPKEADEGESPEKDRPTDRSGSGRPTPAQNRKSSSDKESESGDADETKDSDGSPSDADAAEDPDAPKKPDEPKKPSKKDALEPYRALFAGTIPAVVEAEGVPAIEAAVKLFREEFEVRMVLLGSADAARVPELLSEHQVAVAAGPELVTRVDGQPVNLPQVLANGQIEFAFQSQAETGVRELPAAVQYAVYRGLGAQDALQGLTATPARILSLDAQIGALKPGMDADLVVLSGPPFELSTEVIAVMIDGQWVYERGAKE